jgi:hypothetical protein
MHTLGEDMDAESTTAAGARARAPGDLPGPLQLELTVRSRALLEVLQDFKGEARKRYEGALRVLADASNPIRFQLCAHALRELMDDIEKEAGVLRQGPSLGVRVRTLREEWSVARDSSAPGSDAIGLGFARRLDDFFAAFDVDLPRRRDRASATLAALDPARREPPPAVRVGRAGAWMEYRDYFTAVAHGSVATVAEFQSRFDGFETFLLDWLRPRTFADLDEIDELLLKGPPDG